MKNSSIITTGGTCLIASEIFLLFSCDSTQSLTVNGKQTLSYSLHDNEIKMSPRQRLPHRPQKVARRKTAANRRCRCHQPHRLARRRTARQPLPRRNRHEKHPSADNWSIRMIFILNISLK